VRIFQTHIQNTEDIMFGIQTSSKEIAIATMITLWIFKCRDSGKTPAMGLKTWDYLNNSIKNSAIPSRSINDFIEQLSKLAGDFFLLII